MSTKFKDKEGREWDLELNVSGVRRVRDECQVNLYEALDGQLVLKLSTDPVLMADVLWAIVEPQAEGVTADQFGEALLGEWFDGAIKAFIEGLQGFFAHPGQRKALAKMIDKTNQALDHVYSVAVTRAEQVDAIGIVDEAVAEQDRRTRSDSSGEPPASAV